MIQKAPEISIKCLNEKEIALNSSLGPISEILVNGQPTGKKVDGAILELAVKWQNFYFLFLTHDIPYEETLSLKLLNESFECVDSAAMLWPYGTGSFGHSEIIQPNKIQFEFFGRTKWMVELFEKRRFRVPFFSESQGVWRWFGFTWHFKVIGRLESESRPWWWKYWGKYRGREDNNESE